MRFSKQTEKHSLVRTIFRRNRNTIPH